MRKVILLISSILLIVLNSQSQSIDNCFTCSTKLLTGIQLEGKSLEELALLRNEIYARKGYVFKNSLYQHFFERQDWYNPLSSNNDVKLSNIETQNINLLKSLEEKIQKKRNLAIQDLKSLKKAMNNHDETVILKFLGSMKAESAEMYKSTLADFKTTLNYIDLEDIHWNKGKGFYSLTIDNGFKKSEYKIAIENDDTITIKGGNDSHSENFGDFDDGYSDYQSESEYQYWWVFEMQDHGIVFKTFGAAG